MSAEAPGRLFWTATAVLCATTLVLLWITAQRIKDAKLAARAGSIGEVITSPPRLRLGPDERPADLLRGIASGRPVDIEADPSRQDALLEEAAKRSIPVRFVANDQGRAGLLLRPGKTVRFETYALTARPGCRLLVEDDRELPCVEFSGFAKGAVRRWQELQLTALDPAQDGLRVEARLLPGSPSFGPGDYHKVKAGLRIEFAGGRSVTLSAWDPAKAGLRIRVEQGDRVEERELAVGVEEAALDVRARLLRNPSGEFLLSVDGPP
jgi:hypothetical protein